MNSVTLDPVSLALGSKFDLTKDKESFQTMKLPVHLKYRIASISGIMQTTEGPVNYQVGDAIMTGTENENWPIEASKFRATYDTYENGFASKKPFLVFGKQMFTPFKVEVNWGGQSSWLKGHPGDYLVQYGVDDFGVVAKKIFENTYDFSKKHFNKL